MNASKQLTQAVEVGLWVTAFTIGGALLLSAGSSGLGEQTFEQSFGRGPDATITVAWSRHGLLGTSSSASAEPPAGWHPLRHRLEACGQRPDDVLEVAVESGTGRWPWTVEVRRSTAGASTCLASVLSTAPLHPTLPTARQSLRVRLRLTDLDIVDTVTPERFARDCTAWHEVSFADQLASGTMQVSADAAADLVCPHPSPLVRATLTYEGGRLVDVTTEPSAPCVEASAREHVSRRPEAWHVLDLQKVVRTVCTFDLPMGDA